MTDAFEQEIPCWIGENIYEPENSISGVFSRPHQSWTIQQNRRWIFVHLY